MKIERTKNASRNIRHGIFLKIYMIVMPFVMRTVMIYTLGIQYLGLNSLFASVLQVLNLAELGVGSAMVYSMYKPIVEDDKQAICALLKLYKKYYRIIAIVITAAGLALLPFIEYLVKADTVPTDINLYFLYILNLAATVSSYCLFAYKNSLLLAFQRTDIESKVTIAVSTVSYILQIAALVFTHNYYVYSIILLATNLFINIVTAIVVNKVFPDYQPSGEISEIESKKIKKRVKDLFTAKLGGTITGSADSIVISAFLGLSTLAIYQNYLFVINAVIGFIIVIFNSTIAGIGNSLIIESKEKNYHDFRIFSLLINWIVIFSISCFMCLFQPFISLWVGGEYLLEYPLVILFCIYFYVFIVQQLACLYKDAAGIWHQDRWRPLISSVVNLALNLAFVQMFGLYAILISTIISYIFVAMPWLTHNVFKNIFCRSAKQYVLFSICGLIIAMVVGSVCLFVCNYINIHPVLDIAIRLVICIIINGVSILVLYRKNDMFNDTLDLVDNVTNYKLHFFIKKIRVREKE